MEIQPIDITQIIVTVITLGVTIYLARKRPGSEREPEGNGETSPRPKAGVWAIVMGITVALLLANLAFFGWRSCSHTTDIKITYPYDGATVEAREMVRGDLSGVPEGDVPWIVVYSQFVGRYYPQNDPADVQANGDWSSLAFVGVEEDVGQQFDIIIVLLDKTAQAAFNAYLSQAKDNEAWPGLASLPEGALIYDRVIVTRK